MQDYSIGKTLKTHTIDIVYGLFFYIFVMGVVLVFHHLHQGPMALDKAGDTSLLPQMKTLLYGMLYHNGLTGVSLTVNLYLTMLASLAALAAMAFHAHKHKRDDLKAVFILYGWLVLLFTYSSSYFQLVTPGTDNEILMGTIVLGLLVLFVAFVCKYWIFSTDAPAMFKAAPFIVMIVVMVNFDRLQQLPSNIFSGYVGAQVNYARLMEDFSPAPWAVYDDCLNVDVREAPMPIFGLLGLVSEPCSLNRYELDGKPLSSIEKRYLVAMDGNFLDYLVLAYSLPESTKEEKAIFLVQAYEDMYEQNGRLDNYDLGSVPNSAFFYHQQGVVLANSEPLYRELSARMQVSTSAAATYLEGLVDNNVYDDYRPALIELFQAWQDHPLEDKNNLITFDRLQQLRIHKKIIDGKSGYNRVPANARLTINNDSATIIF